MDVQASVMTRILCHGTLASVPPPLACARVRQAPFAGVRCLSSAKDFDRRLERFLKDENIRYAHPYRWTYTGEPLVRDTPFSRTRRQQRQGRACLSPRPKPFERLLYAPRPYRQHAA